MSLILEALRKSEAERQRGRAPGLFVAQASVPAPAHRAPTWAWALGALLVVVLAAFGLREWQRGTAAIPMPVAPLPAPAPIPAPTTAPSAAPAAQPTPVPVPVPAAVPTAARAPETARPAPDLPAASAASATPAAAEPALPSLAQLPAGERAQLPALKLSMHVYAEDPAQRFVILDGQRLGEGASPAAGVVLEQIRRDGLVLSVNGQRLLLARP